MDILSEGVFSDGAHGVLQRAFFFTGSLQHTDEIRKLLKEELLETLLFGEYPFIVMTGKQLAAVRLYGIAQCLRLAGMVARLLCGIQSALEELNIRRDNGGIQSNRMAVRQNSVQGEARLSVFKKMSERGERRAQAVPPRIDIALRPEALYEDFSRMILSQVICQIGQERTGLCRSKACRRASGDGQRESTKKLDVAERGLVAMTV